MAIIGLVVGTLVIWFILYSLLKYVNCEQDAYMDEYIKNGNFKNIYEETELW